MNLETYFKFAKWYLEAETIVMLPDGNITGKTVYIVDHTELMLSRDDAGNPTLELYDEEGDRKRLGDLEMVDETTWKFSYRTSVRINGTQDFTRTIKRTLLEE